MFPSRLLAGALLALPLALGAQAPAPSAAAADGPSAEGRDAFGFAERSTPDIALFPFFHGVASGDPLDDAVVIWTRVTTNDPPPLPVNWRVSTDPGMAGVVASGTFVTDASRDFTVKVDVTGLAPDTWYYYEFEYLGRRSLIGRTRTAPAPGAPVDSLRFALVSCSNYQAGYFNAYAHLAGRNDLDAVFHVGDYIYEYESGGYGFEGLPGRDHDPDNEIITLSDYRLRHSWYKLDGDLRAVHQQYPFVAIYDDHEFANDAWRDGAENHNTGEGPWPTRRSAAFQAWLEWMPVRDPAGLLSSSVYRKLPFGGLVDLFVLDTRVEGRDLQDLGATDDPGRSLLGPVQFAWLSQGLRQSTATWKVLVQQVLFAPLEFFGTPINGDAWDGYAAERARLLDTVHAAGVDNFVVLTGDIHSAFSNNIPSAHGNIGAEFVCTSVTSPGLDILGGEGFIQLFNSHVRYVDLSRNGYVLVDLNTSRVQGEHWFVDTKLSPDPDAAPFALHRMDAGTVGLASTSVVSVRPGPGPARPPAAPVNSCAIPGNPVTAAVGATQATVSWDPTPGAVGYLLEGQPLGAPSVRRVRVPGTGRTFTLFDPATTYRWRVAASCDSVNLSPFTAWQVFTTDSGSARLAAQGPQLLGVYPVPFEERLGLQFALPAAARVTARLIDASGRTGWERDFGRLAAGAHFVEDSAGHLAAGTWVLQLCADGWCAERTVLKR